MKCELGPNGRWHRESIPPGVGLRKTEVRAAEGRRMLLGVAENALG